MHGRKAQALIQAGADVNFTLWPDEETALPGACQYGYSIGIVKALLNTGANVNTQTDQVKQPSLHSLCQGMSVDGISMMFCTLTYFDCFLHPILT